MCQIRDIPTILTPPNWFVKRQVEIENFKRNTEQERFHDASPADTVPDPYSFNDPAHSFLFDVGSHGNLHGHEIRVERLRQVRASWAYISEKMVGRERLELPTSSV